MTDRIKGFVITLESDLRTDDVERIVEAISLIRGIGTIEPRKAELGDQFERDRVKREIWGKVLEVIKNA